MIKETRDPVFLEELRKNQLEHINLINRGLGELHKVDGIDCPVCLNKGYNFFLDEFCNEYAIECICMKRRKVAKTIELSGINKDSYKLSFETFTTNTEHHARMKQKAMEYIHDNSNAWLAVVGQSGAGKSHICSAVVHELMKQGKQVKYMTFTEDMPRLTRHLQSFGELRTEAEKDLHHYKTVEILYIDDYLKLSDSPRMFEIINYRYNNGLKTIISSELTAEKQINLDEATFRRIFQMTRQDKYWIEIGYSQDKNQSLQTPF